MIYLDNAGTTKMDYDAQLAMNEINEEYYGNASSLHSMGQSAKDFLEEARAKIAKCLNADAGEIYFTSGGSESDNQAIMSAARLGKLKNKKHIISTTIEHHAVLHTLKRLEDDGFEIELVGVEPNGIVDVKKIESAIRQDTVLVCVMFANNEIGSIQPIAEIAKVCKAKNVLFFTDAVQAVGHEHIDVKKLGVDMLSLSAHKFHGPKGVGALYVRKGAPIFSFIEGGAQEKNKRAGTENVAGIYGMAVALEKAVGEIDEVSAREKKLRDRLIDELSKIPHSILNGDRNIRLSNNVNMCFEGIEGESLLLMLDDEGICASSGSACTSGSLDPSHVLLAIGRPHEVAHGSLRLTLSKYTTEEEVNKVLEVVPKIVDYLRKMSPVWDELNKGERKHVI